MKKLFLSLVFLFCSNVAHSYVLTPPECRFGHLLACVKSGKLEYIIIYNTIYWSDYTDIREIADNLPKDKPFPMVYLHSVGGSLDAAYLIGKIFRKHSVEVKTGNPITGDKYGKCISACVIIAAGAVKRNLVHIGLHSPSSHDDEGNKIIFPEEEYKELEKYLHEMGMDPRLYMMIKSTKNEELLQITYNPNLKGSEQYIVQFGFYQGPVEDEDNSGKPLIKFTHVLYGRESTVFAAMNGSTGALERLVDEYKFGTKDISKDKEREKIWLKIGAEQEDIKSLHNLGALYAEEKNNKTATPYFKRAAELGFAGSQNNYGWHLYKGIGIKRNKAEGVFWIIRAAEQGEPFAYGSLCEIYGAGDVFIPNNIEAMKWCRLAADNMPIGKARDAAVNILDKLASSMKDKDIHAANHTVDLWQPLKQTFYRMRDKDDNGKSVLKRYF